MPSKALPPSGDALAAALDRFRSIDGLVTACVVEPNSAHVIDTLVIDPAGADPLAAATLAAGASDVVQVVELMTSGLGTAEQLEEVIITLGRHHHLITPLPQAGADGLLVVVSLDRNRTNLALARQQLRALGPLFGASAEPADPRRDS
jgi:hypothetical protein